jgi:hypothetical protein
MDADPAGVCEVNPVFGDHLSHELFTKLCQRGMHLITGIRRNMRDYLMPLADKLSIEGDDHDLVQVMPIDGSADSLLCGPEHSQR